MRTRKQRGPEVSWKGRTAFAADGGWGSATWWNFAQFDSGSGSKSSSQSEIACEARRGMPAKFGVLREVVRIDNRLRRYLGDRRKRWQRCFVRVICTTSRELFV